MDASVAAFPHSFYLFLHTQILEENLVSTMASICEIASYDHNVKEEKNISTSKILVIGATGYIHHFVALAAIAASHPTYALIRPTNAFDVAKEKCLHELKDSSVKNIYVCQKLCRREMIFVVLARVICKRQY
ncbi:hypothetical protein SUGI_1239170 [Cryptomeria japonica]|uniref:NmrA-like domain-containing protein n=1 Tax=Cryptomeria japonica TaxID=3369 RepID=A0AAD3NNA8_CRYJA|nr:hypothetical protein SUGI_1239170 [Cryptomeria japonica]